eukprot:765227-Amphidinium_carterae.1
MEVVLTLSTVPCSCEVKWVADGVCDSTSKSTRNQLDASMCTIHANATQDTSSQSIMVLSKNAPQL